MLLHIWSKFGDPSLNGWWVIARTNLVTDGRTDGRTDAGNDNARRPVWPRAKIVERPVERHVLTPLHSNVNSSPHGQNGRHFAGDISKWIFVNEKFCITIRISSKFVSKDQFDNKTTFIHVMAWCLIVDKLLPELMLTQFTDAYMRHQGEMSEQLCCLNCCLCSYNWSNWSGLIKAGPG